MIKLNVKNKKGITLVTLTIAIIIMMIITSTLIYQTTNSAKIRNLNNMYQDVTKIKDKVDLYYANHHTIPVLDTKYENVIQLQGINPNDGDTYYVVDLEALANLNLSYGQDYELYKQTKSNYLTNLYIINERSHSVYFAQGISFEDKMYYTVPEENTQIELNAVLYLENIKSDQNTATIKISGVDKAKGIKSIKLFVDGTEYKMYDYNSDFYEMKTEFLKLTLPLGKNVQCYIKAYDQTGNTQTSEEIILQNYGYIATANDMKRLAELVNNGTDAFSGKTIELMNDIDLQGSETNQWVPIGNSNSTFKGIFNGNGYSIKNLYINSGEYEYAGLFGVINAESKVQNLLLQNCYIYTTNRDVGGIAATSYGKIINCGVTGEIYLNKSEEVKTQREIGGITGISSGGQIIGCYNAADIDVIDGTYIGGISGLVYNSARVENSYNIGNVKNTAREVSNNIHMGGITGFLGGGTPSIKNCYSTCEIALPENKTQYIGGIVGINGGYSHPSGEIINTYCTDANAYSYYKPENSEWHEEGKMNLSEMKNQTFVNILGSAFKEDTNNKNGGYPILEWQD